MNKRGSAIVITISSKYEAKQFIANRLHFGGAVKKVKKCWDAGPELVCLKYYRISHKGLNNCRNGLKKCVMCTRAHPASEHQYKVNGCNKRKGKLYVHIIVWYANCQGNHQV